MLNEEVIKRKLEKITQDAWSVGRETTINHMLKWMLTSMFDEILIPYLNDLEARVNTSEGTDNAPDPLERRVAELEFFLNRILKLETKTAQYGSPGANNNASTDGSLPIPNGNAEATVKSPRGRPQASRTSLS